MPSFFNSYVYPYVYTQKKNCPNLWHCRRLTRCGSQGTDGAARGRSKRRTENLLPTGVGRRAAFGRGQTQPDGTTNSRADQRLRSRQVLGM